MHLRDAKRLKPGMVIFCGDHQFTAKCGRFFDAVVEHVTPRGGIRCREILDHGKKIAKASRWVPYNHVVRVRQ